MALKPASTDPNRKDELKKYEQWLEDGMPSKRGPQGPPTFGVVQQERPKDWTPKKGLPGAVPDADEIRARRYRHLTNVEGKTHDEAWRQVIAEEVAQAKDGGGNG